MSHVTPEQLLDELGISAPQEIDVEVIAEHCGATVVYEPLQTCEARVIGVEDRAIITVNRNSIRSRQRFSAAHELGHWIYDRGVVAIACRDAPMQASWSGGDRETRANWFAADLLLPRAMFVPLAKKRNSSFETVESLSEVFQTSLTATAIRLVQL